MESIFFRKDYDDPTENKVKNNTTVKSGMGFAFFSAVLLMLVTFLPFYGEIHTFYETWHPLIMLGLPGYLVFATGLLAFLFNYFGKHGWAAICGGAVLTVWLVNIIYKTFGPLFAPGRFGGISYERLFGYWCLPIVAAMVLYSSLRLRKKEKE